MPYPKGSARGQLYAIWKRMVKRCTKPSAPDYARYGGRGITVCERWRTFANFADDVGLRPSSRHSIDRIDNTRGYEPGNVRWALPKEQVRNRRTTKFVTWNGQRRSVPEWAELLGLPQDTLYHRLEKWPVERALTEPLHRRSA